MTRSASEWVGHYGAGVRFLFVSIASWATGQYEDVEHDYPAFSR
jgi:hypothetical protein